MNLMLYFHGIPPAQILLSEVESYANNKNENCETTNILNLKFTEDFTTLIDNFNSQQYLYPIL